MRNPDAALALRSALSGAIAAYSAVGDWPGPGDDVQTLAVWLLPGPAYAVFVLCPLLPRRRWATAIGASLALHWGILILGGPPSILFGLYGEIAVSSASVTLMVWLGHELVGRPVSSLRLAAGALLGALIAAPLSGAGDAGAGLHFFAWHPVTAFSSYGFRAEAKGREPSDA